MNAAAPVRVVCPGCRKSILPIPESDLQLRCPGCAAPYSVEGGVLDLLPYGAGPPAALFQMFMQCPPLICLYESVFWRRSPLFAMFTQISFEREYNLIAADADVASCKHCLDIACGTGIYSRRFARELRDGLVCGLDVSMPMLREASRRTRDEGLANVLLIHGDALALPFDQPQFDLVNCSSALHLLHDASGAIAEVYRVLKPHGRFTLAVLRREEGKLMEQYARLNRVVFGVGSFSRSGMTEMLEEAGFSRIRCLHAAGLWLVLSARKS